jgi:hypothetical protein
MWYPQFLQTQRDASISGVFMISEQEEHFSHRPSGTSRFLEPVVGEEDAFRRKNGILNRAIRPIPGPQ